MNGCSIAENRSGEGVRGFGFLVLNFGAGVGDSGSTRRRFIMYISLISRELSSTAESERRVAVPWHRHQKSGLDGQIIIRFSVSHVNGIPF